MQFARILSLDLPAPAFAKLALLGILGSALLGEGSLAFSQTTAAADAISGPGINGVPQVAGGMATFEVWAYSDNGGAVKNVPLTSRFASPTSSAVVGAVRVPMKALGVWRGLFGLGWSSQVYTSCYGIGVAPAAGPMAKTPLHAWVSSATAAGGSWASGDFLPPSMMSPKNRVRASAASTGAGSCAGEATDPVDLLDGDHPFAPE